MIYDKKIKMFTLNIMVKVNKNVLKVSRKHLSKLTR